MNRAVLIDHGGIAMPLHSPGRPSPTDLHTPTVCGFCGRSRKECRTLIGNPQGGAFICDECLRDAAAALAEAEARS